MSNENNTHPLPPDTQPARLVEQARAKAKRDALTGGEVALLEDAEQDPCVPIRNLVGHLVYCNYGDWADFTKCKCAEGLLTAPEQKTAFVVAPMPLRDILASSIQVSDEMAHDLAMGIRKAQKQGQKIETVGEVLGVSNEPLLTLIELADARAKIRYLEADAMISWRSISLRMNAEAKTKADAKPEAKAREQPETMNRVCQCGHAAIGHARDKEGKLMGCTQCYCSLWNPDTKPEATLTCVCGHSLIQHEAGALGGNSVCMLQTCGCKSYKSRPGGPLIVAPGNSRG